jgi:wyosine [tRNA(Phe)-imidazoG37] synthetase (radical SAM superfamily)
MQVERQRFYGPEEILRSVREKVERVREKGEAIDYLAFVPDGEPVLDIHIAREMELLGSLGINIAVITNASLMWRKDVREDLMKADWISLKIDAIQEKVWRKINRPYGALQLASILDGILEFAEGYKGELVTETMLVEGVNDSKDHLIGIANFLSRLRPAKAYLSIPTRPPAEEWVKPPGEETINGAYQIIHEQIDRVEYLIGYEGNAFALTGNVEDDLLSITAVHPMREEAVRDLLTRAGADWSVIHSLILRDQLIVTEYDGMKFYMRELDPGHTQERSPPG